MSEIVKLPLWKNCLEIMRADGLDFGKSWPVKFFSEHLKCEPDSAQFQFEMLSLKQALEDDDGYYLQQTNSGKSWAIPLAGEHEDVAKTFERKLRRYAIRSISIRSSVLSNPKAELSESDRQKMEGGLDRAQFRLLMLTRQRPIQSAVRGNKLNSSGFKQIANLLKVPDMKGKSED